MEPWNNSNVEKRILLDDVDFEKLTKGEIIDKDGVKIALSDIGYLKMYEILDKNYNNSLNDAYLNQQKHKYDTNFDICNDFIEYTDNDDNYIEPERKFSNECIDKRLYCLYRDCKQYIKGQERYNGLFVTENGKEADLKNQCWFCKKHDKDNK